MGEQALTGDTGAGGRRLAGTSYESLHPRPGVPWPLVLVLVPALAGLAGLFIRADGAFEAIARPGALGRWEGLLIAFFIEGANVVEGMILFRPRRPGDRLWPALIAGLVSFVVSVFYNFAVGISHADPALEYLFSRHVHVAVLSVGVSLALVSYGMIIGELFAEWQRAVEQWEAARAAWLEKERARRERRSRRQQRKAVALQKRPANGSAPAPVREKSSYLAEATRVLAAQPEIGARARAREIACSPSTASALLRQLRSSNGERGA